MAKTVRGLEDVSIQAKGLGRHREIMLHIAYKAQEDLSRAISALVAASDPDSRQSHLLGVSDEYIRVCNGKMKWLKEIALLTPGCGVVLAVDGLQNRNPVKGPG